MFLEISRNSSRPATLFKKRLWYMCFPVNFEKFSRTLFLQNISGWRLTAIKKIILEILQNSQQNTRVGVSCLSKLQSWGRQLFWKRDSDTSAFPWILQKFLGTYFDNSRYLDFHFGKGFYATLYQTKTDLLIEQSTT